LVTQKLTPTGVPGDRKELSKLKEQEKFWVCCSAPGKKFGKAREKKGAKKLSGEGVGE